MESETVERLPAGHALFGPGHSMPKWSRRFVACPGGNSELADVVPGALRHLAGMPVRRMPLAPLLRRMLELRDNITASDAAHVALAKRVGRLTTCHAKLAGARCEFDLIA